MLPGLVEGVLARDRTILSKAITLVESSLESDRQQSVALFRKLQAKRPDSKALRLGLTGAPGVGKSSFIESFGGYLTRTLDKHIAVLAVDPSSPQSGGSILGDKTRMPALSVNPKAFIRPSPSRGYLGGVVASSYDAIRLCEYAGFDVVLVESVGVGQSELSLADLVDLYILIVAPGAGDELQGIKKGISELADLILVNKCEDPRSQQAKTTLFEYRSAMKFQKPRYEGYQGQVQVLPVSAHTSLGIPEAWQAMSSMAEYLKDLGVIDGKRDQQYRTWARMMAIERLTHRFDTYCKDRIGSVTTDQPIQQLADDLVAQWLASNPSWDVTRHNASPKK